MSCIYICDFANTINVLIGVKLANASCLWLSSDHILITICMRYLDEKKSKGAHVHRTWVGVIHRLSVNRKYLMDKFWQVQKGCLHQDIQILGKKKKCTVNLRTQRPVLCLYRGMHTRLFTLLQFLKGYSMTGTPLHHPDHLELLLVYTCSFKIRTGVLFPTRDCRAPWMDFFVMLSYPMTDNVKS